MLSFSGWNLIGTFAFLLKGQGLNMVLNVYFGPIINAARGVAYQVNGAINGFSTNIATAFRPQIVNTYAQGDNDKTKYLMFMRVCYALMCLLTIPIMLELDVLLPLWLGDAIPANTKIFAILVLIDSLVCTLNTPCSQVAFAVGRINKYQIATSLVNLGLIPVSWLFLYLGYDAVSVFVITIIFSVVNQLVCLIQLKYIFPYKLRDYLKTVIVPCCVMTVVLPIIPFFVHNVMSFSILRFLLVLVTDVIGGIILMYFVVLSGKERLKTVQYVKEMFFRK